MSPDRPTYQGSYRWVVAYTKVPETFWIIAEPGKLRRSILDGSLTPQSIHRDNPELLVFDAETTEAAMIQAEAMGLAHWPSTPWTQLQRAIVAVLHWQQWRHYEDLSSQTIDWWVSGLSCHYSRSSVLRIQHLGKAEALTLETLWHINTALDDVPPTRLIERFLALSLDDQSAILDAALIDHFDEPVMAMLRAGLPKGRTSGDDSRKHISALMGLTERYSERCLLLAVREYVDLRLKELMQEHESSRGFQ